MRNISRDYDATQPGNGLRELARGRSIEPYIARKFRLILLLGNVIVQEFTGWVLLREIALRKECLCVRNERNKINSQQKSLNEFPY